jgi:hypothetical protein
VLVAFEGELHMAAADAAGDAFGQALSEESTAAGRPESLNFMDSTGLHRLIGAKRLADNSGRRLAVLKGSEPAYRLLALAGSETFFEMLDDLDEVNGSHALSSPQGPESESFETTRARVSLRPVAHIVARTTSLTTRSASRPGFRR